MLESSIEEYLVEQVERAGGLCEKHVSPGRRGAPDRLVTWPDGTMDLVETKAPTGTVKRHQLRDHKRRRERGVIVHLIYTKAQVDRYMRRGT